MLQSPEDSSRYSVRTFVSSSKCRRVDKAPVHREREMHGKGETILNCQWLNVTKDRACVVTEGTGEICVRQTVSGKWNEEATPRVLRGEVTVTTTLEMM